MIYVSAAYFAQYHTDMSEVEETLRQMIKHWPIRAWVHASEARDQVNINWSIDTTPTDIYRDLGAQLDGAAQQLTDCPPDFIGITYQGQDFYYSTHRSWSDARRKELTDAAQLVAA